MKKLAILLCSLWLGLGAFAARGQEVINHNYDGYAEKETPLAEMAAQSSVIVEGKVIGRRGFWNDKHTKVYSANTVKVYKIFKGEVQGGQVEIVTEGGNVGDLMTFTFDDDKLPVEGTGIFFGQPVTEGTGGSKLPPAQVLKIYGFYQGHFSYRGDGPDYNTAVTASRFYRNVPKTLYEPIQRAVGHPYRELVPFDIDVYDVYEDLRTGLSPNGPQAKALQAKLLQKKSSNSSLSPSAALANPTALPVITSVSARQNGVLVLNGPVKGGTFDEIVIRGLG